MAILRAVLTCSILPSILFILGQVGRVGGGDVGFADGFLAMGFREGRVG